MASRRRPGQQADPVSDREESYAALVALIEEAKSTSTSASSSCTRPGGSGDHRAPCAPRRTRVEVRLLLDGVGSLHTRRRFLAPLVDAGGRYAFFMPVLHLPFRGRSNLRNHRKTVIVDERRVLAGGANIASEYMGPQPLPERWRDLTFALEGSSVAHYSELFRSDWSFASGELIPPPLTRPSPPAPARRSSRWCHPGRCSGRSTLRCLVDRAFGARFKLWVVTPYFIPDEALCRALVLAAHRGVDVRLMVPERSNHRLADMAGRSYLREVQHEGGTVLFCSSMLHAKAVLIDDEVAILGSANIDLRSLLLNYEAACLSTARPRSVP